MDALSELLRAVKLSGALFYNSRCTAPWCLAAPHSSAFLPYVAPQATHVIEFHHISEGRAYVRVGEETTPLEAGDMVMIPHGDAHEMGNGTGGEQHRWRGRLAGAVAGTVASRRVRRRRRGNRARLRLPGLRRASSSSRCSRDCRAWCA